MEIITIMTCNYGIKVDSLVIKYICFVSCLKRNANTSLLAYMESLLIVYVEGNVCDL